MIDDPTFLRAKLNLEKIKDINTYVESVLRHFFPVEADTISLHKNNCQAAGILSELEDQKSTVSLDKWLAFWIYELARSPNDNAYSCCGLVRKLHAIREELPRKPRNESLSFDNLPIIQLLSEQDRLIDEFKYRIDDAVILTAVPVEFRACVRKLTYILAVFDRYETERIVNPETDAKKLKKRNNTLWVDGVIVRGNKSVKVRVVLTEKDGADAAQAALNKVAVKYDFPRELLLVGVAGQLDKTNKVRFGDLVISDSFYDGYPKSVVSVNPGGKVINDFLYEDKEPKELPDDYNIPGSFEWASWGPASLFESRPLAKTRTRVRKKLQIFKGPFVCVEGVLKQKFRKNTLRNAFEGALAVEMESLGCYTFVKSRGVDLRVIKSICDWSTPDKEKTWQPYCADVASEFAVDYLIAKYGKMVIDN